MRKTKTFSTRQICSARISYWLSSCWWLYRCLVTSFVGNSLHRESRPQPVGRLETSQPRNWKINAPVDRIFFQETHIPYGEKVEYSIVTHRKCFRNKICIVECVWSKECRNDGLRIGILHHQLPYRNT